MNLANSLHRIRFCALAGVGLARDVRLLPDDIVEGELRVYPKPFYGLPKLTLVEEFANWSDTPDEIVRFTRKYGPLRQIKRPGQFRFSAKDWRRLQKQIKQLWRSRIPKHVVLMWPMSGVKPNPDDEISIIRSEVTYRAASLHRFLLLELCSVPRFRLRICKNPECGNPYFIGRHLRKTYCTTICSQGAQRSWKLRWWREVGSKRRTARNAKSIITRIRKKRSK